MGAIVHDAIINFELMQIWLRYVVNIKFYGGGGG